MSGIEVESEEEYEERRKALIEDAAETKRELEAEQEEILGLIQEEHGGELIETPVSITSQHTATVKTKLDGTLVNRLSYIEDALDPESGESIRDLERAMDRAATILNDVIEEDTYNKALFYEVYEREGPESITTIIERVFDALEEEQKRRAGAVNGFRAERR